MPDRGISSDIELQVDGITQAGLLRCYRHDVAAAYPDNPLAVKSGFIGDLIVPNSIHDGQEFSLSIRSVADKQVNLLAESSVIVCEELNKEIRVRNLNISHLLLDPLTGQSPKELNLIAGIPHFHPNGNWPIIRLSGNGNTHPYSTYAQDFISRANGYVLDFGSGIQSLDRLRDNVINLDAIQFPYVDVVSSCSNLPFRTGVFEGVISQAVFEHLADPFHSAREILRVLKPGGVAFIDTAFMQPFHGDPNHYFNMTTAGLRKIMAGFEIIELGVRPYQLPSSGLIMQLEAILPFVSSSDWRLELTKLCKRLREDGNSFDQSLGEVGQEILAAGVYVVAKKPI